MSKIKTIAMIGHFGGQENFTDGQTVKTKNLYKELSEQTDWEILIVDTYYKNKNPFSESIFVYPNIFSILGPSTTNAASSARSMVYVSFRKK